MAQQDPNQPAVLLRDRLAESLTEFGERAHEAEEGIAVPPPPDEVERAVDALLAAQPTIVECPECGTAIRVISPRD